MVGTISEKRGMLFLLPRTASCRLFNGLSMRWPGYPGLLSWMDITHPDRELGKKITLCLVGIAMRAWAFGIYRVIG
jgi:hypothetical protein